MKPREDPLINVAKLFFACCIVALHCDLCPEGSVVGWMISKVVFRSAVPFFLLCTAYYFFESAKRCGLGVALKKYAQRLAIPLVFYSIVYNAYYAVRMMAAGYSFAETALYIGHHCLFYPLGALWFILAVLVGACLSVLLQTICKKRWVRWMIVSVLYAFALCCNTYYFVVKDTPWGLVVDQYLTVFLSARNGLFLALLYFEIARFISDRKENAQPSVLPKILLLVGLVLLLLESWLTYSQASADDHSLFIAQILWIPSLFLILRDAKISWKCDTAILRKLSSGVYFVHRIIRDPIADLVVLLTATQINSWLLFAMTLSLGLVYSLAISKIPNRWIQKLI